MLSIIIPTLNEEGRIAVVLDDLVPQLREGDEIIVVDGQSDDRTVEIAREYGARVLMQPRNGNGLAKTEGAKAAKNGIVVFVDADTRVPPGFTDRIRNHFSDPDLLLVGGLTLYESESRLRKAVYDSYSRIIFMLGKANHALTGECYAPPNNSAFRKGVFLDAGGYRSVLCEDAELMRRLPRTKSIRYDSGLTLTLSDRRFRSNGFLRTVGLWAWGNLALIIGRGIGTEKYKQGY